jgi:hypothetical protein
MLRSGSVAGPERERGRQGPRLRHLGGLRAPDRRLDLRPQPLRGAAPARLDGARPRPAGRLPEPGRRGPRGRRGRVRGPARRRDGPRRPALHQRPAGGRGARGAAVAARHDRPPPAGAGAGPARGGTAPPRRRRARGPAPRGAGAHHLARDRRRPRRGLRRAARAAGHCPARHRAQADGPGLDRRRATAPVRRRGGPPQGPRDTDRGPGRPDRPPLAAHRRRQPHPGGRARGGAGGLGRGAGPIVPGGASRASWRTPT